ncbi:MAG: CapA family protein [Bacillota bacterium]
MPSREGKDITLNLTGDSLITRRLRPYCEPEFVRMLDRIRSVDAAYTNLEGLLTNFEGYPAAQSGGTYVVGSPEIADDLLWAGFNLFSRANNHSMDWSFDGLLATSRELDMRGMVHSGVGLNLALARSPAYLDTAAGRVALVSTSSTFPAGGHAGKQRADLPGRPGLNPLRFRTRYEVPEAELETLRAETKR